MTTNRTHPNLMPGCTPTDLDHARQLIGDAKRRDLLNPELSAAIREAIADLHAIAHPDADARETAGVISFGPQRGPWEQAVKHLAALIGNGGMLLDDLRLYGTPHPEYLTRASYNGVALALAYHLDMAEIPATKPEAFVPYEATPEGMAEQDIRDVEAALSDWPSYVKHQVKPALKAEWATPTLSRLSLRLKISVQRVTVALSHTKYTVAA